MAEGVADLQRAVEAYSASTTKPSAPAIYQFCSLDIRNSTAYKRAQVDWPVLVDKFYELTWDRLKKDDPTFRLWKHVGDEVLAFRRISNVSEAWRATQHVHRVLQSVLDSLLKGFPRARQEQLSVKGASWIAVCGELQSTKVNDATKILSEAKFRDILTRRSFEADDGQRAETWDFLGPTIDSGFRIAKHSGPGILVLSVELAYLLCSYLRHCTQTAQHSTFCRIVGHQRLPGIWRDRPYPIIWYAPQNEEALQFLSYDDRLALKAELDRFCDPSEQNQLPLCDELRRICTDVGIESALDAIDSALEEQTPASIEEESALLRPRAAATEVHCVAVCVDANERCLIAKRLNSRSLLPDTWEWGCAKLMPNRDFFESMTENYRTVFGVEIEFPSRVPLGTYYIRDRGIPGVIFPARVSGGQPIANAGKHSELKWVSLEDAKALAQAEKVVENFVELVERAIAAIKASLPREAAPLDHAANA